MMSKGITIVELIIALFILTLIILITLPGVLVLLNHHRLQSAATLLDNDLRFSKITANHLRQRVALCISHDQRTCTRIPSNEWHKGWIVFIDQKNNFQPEPHQILRQRPALHPNIRIHSTINIQHGLQMNVGKRSGKGLGTGLPNGHFLLTNLHGKKAHKFTVNIYGRLRSEMIIID